MAEELAFARKASGLVRGLSMWDAFGVGFMNQGLTPSIWVMTSLGVGVYLGGNLIWATIISMILAGIGFPIVWGVLGGSMPRSGGEYIYNSRIIHPIVGIGESFGNAFVWIMWIYVLAPWTADPGMVMMSQFMGWSWLYNTETETFFGGLSYSWGAFVIATVANIIAFLFVVFGIKWFARIQKVVMIFGIGGCVVLLGAISYYAMNLGQSGFIESWNATAATVRLHRLRRLPCGGRRRGRRGHADHVELVRHLRRHGRRLVAVRLQLLHHVHRRRGQAPGQDHHPVQPLRRSSSPASSCSGPRSRCTASSSSTSSAPRSSSTTPAPTWAAAYTVPWSTNFLGLLGMVTTNKLIMFISVLSFLAFNLWWIALSYLAFPRIIFAWGMDRMGPKWFTDINPRFASPVKNHVLCFVLGQIMIAVYVFWQNEAMQGLAVTALEIFSVFGVTAIAALIFPYVKRAMGIWDASPYKTWKIAGIPVVTIGAIVDLVYLGILAYFFFFLPDPAKRLEGFTTNTADPHRRHVDRGHHLVPLLEAAQQERGRRRLDDLRGVAAGVIS